MNKYQGETLLPSSKAFTEFLTIIENPVVGVLSKHNPNEFTILDSHGPYAQLFVMKIQTNDLPQADRLDSVIAATLAVSKGARTDIQIANKVRGIEGDPRQGRYYRRAAEILGFIKNDRNNATITEKGRLISTNPKLSNPRLLDSVLNLTLYQKLLPLFEKNPKGVTQNQVINFLQAISDPSMGGTMIPRRISTIIAWLRTLKVVELTGEKYRLSNKIIPAMPAIELKDSQQPILPARNLNDYKVVSSRIKGAKDVIEIYKDQAKVERAKTSHQNLVNLVANRIKTSGAIPKSNQFIDLAATLKQDFIFEMKSTTELNVKSQVRKGISQLYEYRYLQNRPEATLVLVVENPLISKNGWLVDYMESDREILLIWDGDNSLYGTTRTRAKLDFLRLSKG